MGPGITFFRKLHRLHEHAKHIFKGTGFGPYISSTK
uniref:Uncharacterized protein n=1 Tax=mine drainage metagenome TaxID=410659 RepID=E6QN75_9ZZZZ